MDELVKERVNIVSKLYPKEYINVDLGSSHSMYHVYAARKMGMSGIDLKRIRKKLPHVDNEIFDDLSRILKEKYGDKVTIMINQTFSLVFVVHGRDKDDIVLVGDVDSIGIFYIDGIPEEVDILSNYLEEHIDFQNMILSIRDNYYSNNLNQILIKFVFITDKDTVVKPKESFYPWLMEKGYTIKTFIEEYLRSPESVLVLLGPPGTGKTTFIREILLTYYKETRKQVSITNDQTAMTKALGDLLKEMNEDDVWVLEDSDTIISSTRREGNNTISTLLNTADGLSTVFNNKRKIIFSSNLTDVKQIDTALIRPGRCFAVMYFRNLTRDEALDVSKDLGIELNLPLDLKEISLAEVTNNRENRINAGSVKRIGF